VAAMAAMVIVAAGAATEDVAVAAGLGG